MDGRFESKTARQKSRIRFADLWFVEKLLSMQGQERRGKFAVPAKLYRIGEVVHFTPFSRQTIHNYTTMGLIHEASWTEGGHRLYDESVFERLSNILEMRKSKTLAEIKRILKRESLDNGSGRDDS